MNNQYHINGFTFFELIIVISIISALLVFSLPMFNNMTLFSRRSGQTGDIIRLLEDLKSRAVEQGMNFNLHMDSTQSVAWVTHSGMDERQKQAARQNATQINDELTLGDIEFADSRQTWDQEYQLIFHQEGYSDFALIHIIENSTEMTLRLEPFLSNVELIKGHVSFENCR